jgi:hypothetical protein
MTTNFRNQAGIVSALLVLSLFRPAQAEADGPDFYRVQGAPSGQPLSLRADPDPISSPIGVIPVDASCLRNLGCQGGLSIEEFTSLSEQERRRRQEANPRWCKVEYRGATGWVDGRYLAEGACPKTSLLPNQRIVVIPPGRNKPALKGRIQGGEYVDYRIRVAAGQTLSVTLKGSNPQNYFNVLPPGSEDAAMFIGSSAGNQFERIAPVEGVYVVRTYLMRAAARRNAVSNYALQIGVTGQALKPVPAKQDALIPGTPFHASGSIPCKIDMNPALQRCEAYVIRRSFDGTATVEVRWTLGTAAMVRRVLMIKGAPVSTDSPSEFSFVREADELVLTIGTEEQYRIPVALVVGG